jgi:hypothetical protein
VDFYEYEQAMKDLKHTGVLPVIQNETLRFEFDQSHYQPEQLSVLHLVTNDETHTDTPCSKFVRVDRARLPNICEDILHALRLDEAMLIPRHTWGAIINIAVFDLTDHDSWLAIDAESSLYQNKRDPLEIGPSDFGFIPCLFASLLDHGQDDTVDVNLLTLGAPIIMDLSHAGSVTITCGNAGMLDSLVEKQLG